MKKTIALMSLTAVFTAAGFGLYASGTKEVPAAESSIAITDDLGREVLFPANPQRVAALTRNFMEQLLELGVPLVGKVDEYTHRSEGVNLPSVGKQATPNLEALTALAPDLIFANTRQHAGIADALSATGAAVFFMDPNIWEKDPMLDRLELFARLLGREEEYARHVEELDTLTASIREKTAAAGYSRAILLQVTKQGVTAAQPTGQFGWYLMRSGLENVVPTGLQGSKESTWVPFDPESIAAANPDVVILRASASSKDVLAKTRDEFMEDPKWSTLSAVKSGRVFIIPANLDTGNMGNIGALTLFGNSIHP